MAIFFSDIVDFAKLTEQLGDRAAAEVINRALQLQAQIVERDGAGQVLQFGGDSVFAVFESPSPAMNRALEVQQRLHELREAEPAAHIPHVRIGLHMGEVLLREGDRVEVVGRHVNRAHRVMSMAEGDQVLASRAVVDAGADFIDAVPREHLRVSHYGEFYLKGVGPTLLSEVADLRVRRPRRPDALADPQVAVAARLEQAGFDQIERVGEGGFGTVYRARDTRSGMHVAIKVLAPHWLTDPHVRQRFAVEARRLRQLQLPGLVRILEDRLEHTPPFFVTELVEGRPIDAALADADARHIAQVFERLCGHVGAAHDAGVIHCDLKPANVLVSDDDEPVILDFGQAVLEQQPVTPGTTTFAAMGTPNYLAPEQIRHEPPTPQTDVYALGALLYRVLTGQELFGAESVHDVLEAHLHTDPRLPELVRAGVDDALQRICLKALEKAPADRYRSAAAMAADLHRAAHGQIVRTRPSFYDNILYHRVRRHIDDVQEWEDEGLLSEEEANRLNAAYEPLRRRGVPAVMEGRRLRAWQALVYIGGWAVVNGATLWLMQHDLPTFWKLTLGSLPAVTSLLLALIMWRLGQFRLLFVALVVAVAAMPLLVGVWVDEFEIGHYVPEPEQAAYELVPGFLTNTQFVIMGAATFAVALTLLIATATRVHSAQTMVALSLLYSAVLLKFGMYPRVMAGQWATVALWYTPLVGLSVIAIVALLRWPRARAAVSPWVYLAALTLTLVVITMARSGYEDWIDRPHLDSLNQQYLNARSTYRAQRTETTRLEISRLNRLLGQQRSVIERTCQLLTALGGAVLAATGVFARRRLRHWGRSATMAVITIGPITILWNLFQAGGGPQYPDNWPTVTLLGGEPIPLPHALMPLVSLAIALCAARVQIVFMLLIGLAGLSVSVHLIGLLYFDEREIWPATVMSVGAALFAVSLFIELRRIRGNAIDDIATRKRL